MVLLVGVACLDLIFVAVVISMLVLELFKILVAFSFLLLRELKSV